MRGLVDQVNKFEDGSWSTVLDYLTFKSKQCLIPNILTDWPMYQYDVSVIPGLYQCGNWLGGGGNENDRSPIEPCVNWAG
jgi:hypothetical protein